MTVGKSQKKLLSPNGLRAQKMQMKGIGAGGSETVENQHDFK